MLWIGRLLVDGQLGLMLTFWVLVVAELIVPPLAERHGTTPYHPHHIAERYSLLTIIVLGEVILASVQAVQGALDQGGEPALLPVLAGGVLIVFSMWWLYFNHDFVSLFQRSVRVTFIVGYGHYAVFASVAATGAALAAAVDVAQGQGQVTDRAVGVALGLAVAVYLVVLSVTQVATGGSRRDFVVAIAVAAGAVGTGVVGPPVGVATLLIGALLALAVAQHVWSTRLRAQAEVDAAVPS